METLAADSFHEHVFKGVSHKFETFKKIFDIALSVPIIYITSENFMIRSQISKKLINLIQNMELTVETFLTMFFSFNLVVLKAETLQALKCVDSNLSFASANGDGEGFI